MARGPAAGPGPMLIPGGQGPAGPGNGDESERDRRLHHEDRRMLPSRMVPVPAEEQDRHHPETGEGQGVSALLEVQTAEVKRGPRKAGLHITIVLLLRHHKRYLHLHFRVHPRFHQP